MRPLDPLSEANGRSIRGVARLFAAVEPRGTASFPVEPEAAVLAGRSVSTFRLRVRLVTGTSRRAYRLMLVVAEAKRRLESPLSRVGAAALEFCYGSVAPFVRAFRRAMGTSPGRCQRRERVGRQSGPEVEGWNGSRVRPRNGGLFARAASA